MAKRATLIFRYIWRSPSFIGWRGLAEAAETNTEIETALTHISFRWPRRYWGLGTNVYWETYFETNMDRLATSSPQPIGGERATRYV